MRSTLMQSLAAGVAALLFQFTPASAQQNAAIEGVVSSEAEGLMEGVVVSARKPNGIVMVSVVTDEKGKFAFPKDRLETGDYKIGRAHV